MSERKCPACGAVVQEATAKCPDCGLEGLDLRFLSKAGYEKWVKEVLEPHKTSLPLKVFAGRSYGLILSGAGDLYGIGDNFWGSIEEDGAGQYDQPHLMAKDVISAAAGSYYSIYVTQDGKVHLRGKGKVTKQFPGFAGAKAVYAAREFWIVDENDQVWIYDEVQSGEDSVYRLVPCPECQWMLHTPHRMGSKPVRVKEEFTSTIKKCAIPGPIKDTVLFLSENGMVEWRNHGKLEWITQPVVDIGVSNYFIILACANGDILWHYQFLLLDVFDALLNEPLYGFLMNGKMKVCRLLEDA